MPKQLTPQTFIASVAGLSDASKAALNAAGYTLLAHLNEVDFESIATHLQLPPAPTSRKPLPADVVLAKRKALLAKERRVLFDATVKSGIAVRFKPDAALSSLPTMSSQTLKKLQTKGVERFCDLSGYDFPAIYDLLGYGVGKKLLLGVVLAGVKVKFDEPNWTQGEWRWFVENAVAGGILTWEDVAVTLCGEMNPPQVGTAVASAVKHLYDEGQAMQKVWRWLYSLDGRCSVSGKRLFLEADHIIPKEQFIKEGSNIKDADTLENFQLLTKRENVIKRGSHKLGGLSFAPAAAVLPYIILRYKPRTYTKFVCLCRRHGLTMADVRFQEGWAFAAWLAKAGEYEIDGEVAPFIKDAGDDSLDDEADEEEGVGEGQPLPAGGTPE